MPLASDSSLLPNRTQPHVDVAPHPQAWARALWSILIATVFALTVLVLVLHGAATLQSPAQPEPRAPIAATTRVQQPASDLDDTAFPNGDDPHGLEVDGEAAYPAAGQSVRAPGDGVDATDRQPLRKYPGKSITLLTDTRHEYAAELLVKLDSFMVQANNTLTDILAVRAPAKPTQLIVFESQERYQEYARDNAPGLINNGGYYDGATRTAVTYRYNNSMQLYFHELVHVMMGEQFSDHSFSRYTRKNWPIWFDEGVCEFVGSYEVVGAGIHVPGLNKGKLSYLVNALHHSSFIDLPTLVRAPTERFSGASMNIYYAESWGLVDFLVHSPAHKGKFTQYFQHIHAGEDGLTAFKAVFGQDLVALDTQWRQYIAERAQVSDGEVQLFNGQSIDDWAIHEGGQWLVTGGEIQAAGNTNHNYLIKSELPVGDFSFDLDLNLSRGTAGVILGNNFHGEYPYYFLIDVSRDAVLLRRASSASMLEPLMQAWADIPLGKWRHLRVSVVNHVLRVEVAGREALAMRVDRDVYSLFGVHVSQARARFRNLTVRPEHRALATETPPMTPAGGPLEVPVPANGARKK